MFLARFVHVGGSLLGVIICLVFLPRCKSDAVYQDVTTADGTGLLDHMSPLADNSEWGGGETTEDLSSSDRAGSILDTSPDGLGFSSPDGLGFSCQNETGLKMCWWNTDTDAWVASTCLDSQCGGRLVAKFLVPDGAGQMLLGGWWLPGLPKVAVPGEEVPPCLVASADAMPAGFAYWRIDPAGGKSSLVQLEVVPAPYLRGWVEEVEMVGEWLDTGQGLGLSTLRCGSSNCATYPSLSYFLPMDGFLASGCGMYEALGVNWCHLGSETTGVEFVMNAVSCVPTGIPPVAAGGVDVPVGISCVSADSALQSGCVCGAEGTGYIAADHGFLRADFLEMPELSLTVDFDGTVCPAEPCERPYVFGGVLEQESLLFVRGGKFDRWLVLELPLSGDGGQTGGTFTHPGNVPRFWGFWGGTTLHCWAASDDIECSQDSSIGSPTATGTCSAVVSCTANGGVWSVGNVTLDFDVPVVM